MVPKKIVIVASPRTGTNLLMCSLMAHPRAVSGSEWFNPHLARISPDAFARKVAGVPCTLLKIFGHERGYQGFDEVLESGISVHLYRRDKAAQLASWKKACETGQWMAHHQPGEFPFPWPEDAAGMVRMGDEMSSRCTVSLSYEVLVEHWDAVLPMVLAMAGWEPMPIPMGIERQLARA